MTKEVFVRGVVIGGGNPIVVQSMTNTPTQDVEATVQQINDLYNTGSELVRITVNTLPAARAVPEIRKRIGDIPLIGDFHFNGHMLLEQVPECAQALDKWRINPGTSINDSNFLKFIELAVKYDKPIRIGVNWGSLDQTLLAKLMDENAKNGNPKSNRDVVMDTMIESATQSVRMAEEKGCTKIVLSVKTSQVNDVIECYERLAKVTDYPLHIGLTEAGMGMKGIVSSSVAMGVLLKKGIGDTIRVSLTPAPGGKRTDEVRAAKEILQSLDIRHFQPTVSSCPGCGRTSSDRYQHMAKRMNEFIEEKMPVWKQKYHNVENVHIAVMGCVVNGPGESKQAHVGISLPGDNENPTCPVYVEGKLYRNLKGDNVMNEFEEIVEEYLSKRSFSPE